MHPSGHAATAMPASPPKAGARRAAPLDAPSAMAAPTIASDTDFPGLSTERKKSAHAALLPPPLPPPPPRPWRRLADCLPCLPMVRP